MTGEKGDVNMETQEKTSKEADEQLRRELLAMISQSEESATLQVTEASNNGDGEVKANSPTAIEASDVNRDASKEQEVITLDDSDDDDMGEDERLRKELLDAMEAASTNYRLEVNPPTKREGEKAEVSVVASRSTDEDGHMRNETDNNKHTDNQKEATSEASSLMEIDKNEDVTSVLNMDDDNHEDDKNEVIEPTNNNPEDKEKGTSEVAIEVDDETSKEVNGEAGAEEKNEAPVTKSDDQRILELIQAIEKAETRASNQRTSNGVNAENPVTSAAPSSTLETEEEEETGPKKKKLKTIDRVFASVAEAEAHQKLGPGDEVDETIYRICEYEKYRFFVKRDEEWDKAKSRLQGPSWLIPKAMVDYILGKVPRTEENKVKAMNAGYAKDDYIVFDLLQTSPEKGEITKSYLIDSQKKVNDLIEFVDQLTQTDYHRKWRVPELFFGTNKFKLCRNKNEVLRNLMKNNQQKFFIRLVYRDTDQEELAELLRKEEKEARTREFDCVKEDKEYRDRQSKKNRGWEKGQCDNERRYPKSDKPTQWDAENVKMSAVELCDRIVDDIGVDPDEDQMPMLEREEGTDGGELDGPPQLVREGASSEAREGPSQPTPRGFPQIPVKNAYQGQALTEDERQERKRDYMEQLKQIVKRISFYYKFPFVLDEYDPNYAVYIKQTDQKIQKTAHGRTRMMADMKEYEKKIKYFKNDQTMDVEERRKGIADNMYFFNLTKDISENADKEGLKEAKNIVRTAVQSIIERNRRILWAREQKKAGVPVTPEMHVLLNQRTQLIPENITDQLALPADDSESSLVKTYVELEKKENAEEMARAMARVAQQQPMGQQRQAIQHQQQSRKRKNGQPQKVTMEEHMIEQRRIAQQHQMTHQEQVAQQHKMALQDHMTQQRRMAQQQNVQQQHASQQRAMQNHFEQQRSLAHMTPQQRLAHRQQITQHQAFIEQQKLAQKEQISYRQQVDPRQRSMQQQQSGQHPNMAPQIYKMNNKVFQPAGLVQPAMPNIGQQMNIQQVQLAQQHVQFMSQHRDQHAQQRQTMASLGVPQGQPRHLMAQAVGVPQGAQQGGQQVHQRHLIAQPGAQSEHLQLIAPQRPIATSPALQNAAHRKSPHMPHLVPQQAQQTQPIASQPPVRLSQTTHSVQYITPIEAKTAKIVTANGSAWKEQPEEIIKRLVKVNSGTSPPNSVNPQLGQPMMPMARVISPQGTPSGAQMPNVVVRPVKQAVRRMANIVPQVVPIEISPSDMRPNTNQSEDNMYVSCTNKNYPAATVKWEHAERPPTTHVDYSATVRAVYEYRQTCYVLKYAPPENFLAPYYKGAIVPPVGTEVNVGHYNMLISRRRCDEAHVVLPEISAANMKDLFYLNLNPIDHNQVNIDKFNLLVGFITEADYRKRNGEYTAPPSKKSRKAKNPVKVVKEDEESKPPSLHPQVDNSSTSSEASRNSYTDTPHAPAAHSQAIKQN